VIKDTNGWFTCGLAVGQGWGLHGRNGEKRNNGEMTIAKVSEYVSNRGDE
jgi:hypothetical protein